MCDCVQQKGGGGKKWGGGGRAGTLFEREEKPLKALPGGQGSEYVVLWFNLGEERAGDFTFSRVVT